jgi:ribonucleoside-diphosphate reductase alpha chain
MAYLSEDGEIKASNPCSEYMFLDDTACNLASLNLVKFYDIKISKFNIELTVMQQDMDNSS